MKKQDLTGMRFGRLVVVKQMEDHVSAGGHHSIQWLCKCDCGNEVIRTSASLKRTKDSSKTSCGCNAHPRLDLTGQTFGELTVIEPAGDCIDLNKQRRSQWKCLCSCGRVTVVGTNSLRTGNTRSCGNCGKKREGESLLMNNGDVATIVHYRSSKDIDVKFESTGYVKEHCSYANFLLRNLKDDEHPIFYGVQFIQPKKIPHNGIEAIAYTEWKHLIRRTKCQEFQEKYWTYRDCDMSPEWHNFDSFCAWFVENYWNAGNERMCVDKDILHKNNKLYSASTCCIVPHRINMLFVKNDEQRGELPIGVRKHKNARRYSTVMSKDGKQVYLGQYDTPQQAYEKYKYEKEKYIKQVADEYKAKYLDFPHKLYDAMYAYEVEITD